MNKIDIHKRRLGLSLENGEAEFLLWAPFAKQAELVLENQQFIPLNQKDFGYWEAKAGMIKPGNRYKIRLDDEKELPDPVSLFQPPGVHGWSETVDISAFQWTDKSWDNIPLEDYLIYELHTGTFTAEGTFAGIEKKLDYLLSLGINAIEIMPAAQFPGERNWGYDGVFPFAVQNSYGGPEALHRLVDACHQKGLAVILDVVYNHLGPEGNYLGEFGPYFTDKYRTPWGNAVNFDDEYCDGVRRYFIENALMWFRDFHIDALRLDAVHAIKDFSPVHILREMKQCVDRLMQETGKTHYLIVELDLNDNRFINPLGKCGYGMDAQWIDEFHHALRVAAGGEQSGYYTDFNGIEHLAKAYKDAYVYDGIYSPHRKKIFGTKASENPGKQFVVFSQNHDQVGNRMLGERSSQLFSFEMQKLMAGAVLASPYLPMLFMGEEWGETNPFLYFVSHTDPELAEAVRKGRKEEFKAFHSQGEAPDPMAEDTFQQSKLQWNLLKKEPHGTLWNYYRELIALRKLTPALKHLNRASIDVKTDENKQTILLQRSYENQKLSCLMNFSKQVQEVTLPEGNWKKLFDSADAKWNGPGSLADNIQEGKLIRIQPESILVIEHVIARS